MSKAHVAELRSKVAIRTAKFDTTQDWNLSRNAFRVYCLTEDVLDVAKGLERRPEREIVNNFSRTFDVYDATGQLDIHATHEAVKAAQAQADKEFDRLTTKFNRKCIKVIGIMCNWLQDSTQSDLLSRINLENDEWFDVLCLLEDTHGTQNLLGDMDLIKEFCNMKRVKGQSYRDYMTKLSNVVTKLRNAGKYADDDQIKMKIIEAAPEKLKQVLTLMLTQNASVEDVRIAALQWSGHDSIHEDLHIESHYNQGPFNPQIGRGRGGGRFSFRGRGGGRSGGRFQRSGGKQITSWNKPIDNSQRGGRGRSAGRFGNRNLQSTTSTQVTCYNCGNQGHMSKDCTQPCKYCHVNGHLSKDCWYKPKGQQQNEKKQPENYQITIPGQFMQNSVQPMTSSSSTSDNNIQPQYNFSIPSSMFRSSDACTMVHVDSDNVTFGKNTEEQGNKEIVTDDCATYHLWGDRDMFTEYYPLRHKLFHATSSGGNEMRILGFGAVGNLHHVFHVEGLVKNLVSLAYLSNVLGYVYVGRPGECNLYDRDQTTLIWSAKVTDRSLLPKLDPAVLYSDKLNLTLPNGESMKSTPAAMGFLQQS